MHVESLTFPNGWKTRPYQIPFFKAMGSGIKRAMLVWHRRAGKDVTAWNWCIAEAARVTGTYYYLFPEFAQGKRVLWNGFDKEGTRFLHYIPFWKNCQFNETEMRITFPKINGGSNGSIIQVVGTDNYNALMGTNPIGCVFSEYSLQNPGAWKFIRPILDQNQGWAVFVMTPRGPNHAKQLWDLVEHSREWYTSRLTVEQTMDNEGNPIISPEVVQRARAEGEEEDHIQQEWYTSWLGAQQGSFYSHVMRQALSDERIGNFPHSPFYPVHVYADIGRDRTVLILAQHLSETIRIIDVISETQQELPYFATRLNEAARIHGYVYGGFYWPHDMRVKEFSGGGSRFATALKLGLKPSFVVTGQNKVKIPFEDGVDATRRMFRNLQFHQPKCQKLLDALWSYRRKYDEVNKTLLKEPVHDIHSHYADALRTLATAKKPTVNSLYARNYESRSEEATHQYDPLAGYAGVT